MDGEKLSESQRKGEFRWMKKWEWDLRRKWEQVNVPKILFLSKQDVLWCFIYKPTKALKADRAGLAAKSTEDRQQWQEEGVERGLRGGEKDTV